jgi:hypothetical protein
VATSQAIRKAHGWEHDLGSPHATREALADAVTADIDQHGPAGVVALAVSHADCEDVADRIRTRLRASGYIHGPELAGPAWRTGERHHAAGDRLLIHGTLHSDGQRLHNGTVVTIAAVGQDGLHAVDANGHTVAIPRAFVEGHRPDGSPNCSRAWCRTVDGVQGGTWPQVHLLGTAALERFTGYTAQSRGRYATHTWNVTRLPDIDYGGVLADQRTADKDVLDSLRREPESGFAIHEAPSRVGSSEIKPNSGTSSEAVLMMSDRRCAKLKLPSATPRRSATGPATGSNTPRRASPGSGHSRNCATTAARKKPRRSTTSTASPATSSGPKRRSPAAGMTSRTYEVAETTGKNGTSNTAGPTSASAPSTPSCGPSPNPREAATPTGQRTSPSVPRTLATPGSTTSPRSPGHHFPVTTTGSISGCKKTGTSDPVAAGQ